MKQFSKILKSLLIVRFVLSFSVISSLLVVDISLCDKLSLWVLSFVVVFSVNSSSLSILV